MRSVPPAPAVLFAQADAPPPRGLGAVPRALARRVAEQGLPALGNAVPRIAGMIVMVVTGALVALLLAPFAAA